MDVDGGMTWFRHEDYHAESPPECGWMVFKEGHGYVESDLKVSLEEAWPCVSLFISAATLHHIQAFKIVTGARADTYLRDRIRRKLPPGGGEEMEW